MYDVQEFKRLYESGSSLNQIADKFQLGYKLVRGRLLKAGVKMRPNKYKFTEEETKSIVDRYSSNYTGQELARELGCSIAVIKNLILKAGVPWDNKPTNYKLKNGYKVNRECFKNFDTESELYFYGLLLADGCIVSDTNSVQITLQKNDKDILDKLSKFVGTDKSLTTRFVSGKYHNTTFCMGDKEIADKLRSVGMESRKSLREKVPSFYNVKDVNMRHFWRGFVDGDGTVQSLENYRARLLGLIGTKEILEEFAKFCLEHSNALDYRINQNKQVNKNCYEFAATGQDASEIANLLYMDSEYHLDRKKVQADSLSKLVGVQRPAPRRYFHELNTYASNSTGAKGVGKSIHSHVASISVDCKRYTKSFSISAYGVDESFRLACDWRKNMEEFHSPKQD